MTTKIWTLTELFELFPDQRRHSDAVRRCLSAVSGHGRFIREAAGQTHFAEVKLLVEPSQQFSVTFGGRLSDASSQRLAQGVLRGIFAGASDSNPPAWGCQIECVEVTADPLAADTVAIAASMAIQDALRKPGWDPEDPNSEPAGRAKVA